VRLAAHDGARGAIVNLGNPEETTIAQAAQLIAEAAGVPFRSVQRPLPPDDPTRRKPDITRARELLGWEPKIGFREGIARTLAWWRSARPV
jgi:nucleoside-diphosphate-sugar epimerase